MSFRIFSYSVIFKAKLPAFPLIVLPQGKEAFDRLSLLHRIADSDAQTAPVYS